MKPGNEMIGEIKLGTYPTSVDEDLCCVGDGRGSNLLQVLHAPLLQELQDGGRGITHRYVGHQSKIFHLL